MRVTKALVFILSTIVPLAVTAPAASPDALPVHAPIDEDSQSPSSPLLKRGDNYCSPTGRESCNFWIKTTIPIAGNYYQRWWGLYNYRCDKIGGSDQSLSVNDHWSLNSQLPYTIELSIPSGGFTPNGHFWYAGRKTDLGGNMYCESCSGITAARCCRVSFRCD